jgi:hypothetical protein
MPLFNQKSSAAAAASLVAKTAPGLALFVTGYNSKASAQFIQLHDAAALPADTAVPIAVITVPASSNFQLPLPATGLDCVNGVVVCNSSTLATKTIGSADCFFTVQTS